MAKVKIRGEHVRAGTRQAYKYQASFEGYGPDLIFKGEIPIPARNKILHVERVLVVDLMADNAVNAVHGEMRKIIDETDLATVECD
jgi:hypothetical protein